MADYSWMAEAKPQEQRQELPVGQYKVFVENFENYQTKQGGRALKITFQVMEGDKQGRKTIQYYNVPDGTLQKTNPNLFSFQKDQICGLAYWFNKDAANVMEFVNSKNLVKYKDMVFTIKIEDYIKKDGTKDTRFKIMEALGKVEVSNTPNAPDPFAVDDPFATD